MILRPATREDYGKYIAHVVEADEVYIQYGYEPTEEILEAIREPYAGTRAIALKRSKSFSRPTSAASSPERPMTKSMERLLTSMKPPCGCWKNVGLRKKP